MKPWEKAIKALKAAPLCDTSFPLHELVDGLLLPTCDIAYEVCICLRGYSPSPVVEPEPTTVLKKHVKLVSEWTYNEQSGDLRPTTAPAFDELVRVISEQRKHAPTRPAEALMKRDNVTKFF
jgi:hypothetical protein